MRDKSIALKDFKSEKNLFDFISGEFPELPSENCIPQFLFDLKILLVRV